MTKKEMAMLADIISARVVDELLTVLKVRGTYNNYGWSQDHSGFEDLYAQYEEMIKEEEGETKPTNKKKKSTNKDESKSEAELVGEMASLMTQMGMHLEKEEYEKCAPIKIRMKEVRKVLKDKFNVDFEIDEE